MASPVPNNDLSQGRASAMLPEMASLRGAHSVKVEGNSQDTPAADIPTHSSRTTRLQEVIQGGILESLEAETASIQPLLENLTQQLVGAAEDQDAQLFLASIKTLQDEPLNTPTIIGVVGNTGAGKSAIINAVLEEEQLVPTNWYDSAMSPKQSLINLVCEHALQLLPRYPGTQAMTRTQSIAQRLSLSNPLIGRKNLLYCWLNSPTRMAKYE